MDMGSLLHQFLQQLINGISLGSIYALIALGYTMIYGILKLINLPMVISICWARILVCSYNNCLVFPFCRQFFLPWPVQPLPVLSLNALPTGRCVTLRVLLF